MRTLHLAILLAAMPAGAAMAAQNGDTAYQQAGKAAAVDQDPTRGEASAQTTTWLASELIGMPVIGAQGEHIGEIEKVIRQGDQIYAVISSGGYLGLGATGLAMRLQDLTLDTDARLIMRDLPRDAVRTMQDIESAQYADLEPTERVEVPVE